MLRYGITTEPSSLSFLPSMMIHTLFTMTRLNSIADLFPLIPSILFLSTSGVSSSYIITRLRTTCYKCEVYTGYTHRQSVTLLASAPPSAMPIHAMSCISYYPAHILNTHKSHINHS